MERRKPLKIDPDKTRAWQERSRKAGGLKRSGIKSGPVRSDLKRPDKPRKGLPARSKKKAVEMRTRAALVQWLAAEGVGCEVCPELARHGIAIPGGCWGLQGIHERRKRSGSGSVEHAPNLIPACNPANGWIETAGNDELRRLGVFPWLVVVEAATDWEECGPGDNPAPVTVKHCPECGAAHVTVPPSGCLPCGHANDPTELPCAS